MIMQGVEATNEALRLVVYVPAAVAMSILHGLNSAKHFWSSKNQSMHPGSPVSVKYLKELLHSAIFRKVRT